MNNNITLRDAFSIDVSNAKPCVFIAAVLLVWHAIDQGYSIRVNGGTEAAGAGFGIELIPRAA